MGRMEHFHEWRGMLMLKLKQHIPTAKNDFSRQLKYSSMLVPCVCRDCYGVGFWARLGYGLRARVVLCARLSSLLSNQTARFVIVIRVVELAAVVFDMTVWTCAQYTR